ncbi:MAG: radical SAM protein [Bacillota bacterium]|nr:radical SAM protein [Bacillota bacterium]
MIRLSAGTAACLGLTGIKMDSYPTTAYLLSGNRCLMKCAFCPQGLSSSEALNKLGRVTWPEFTWDEIEKGFRTAAKSGIKRICLQSVRHNDGIETLLGTIRKIKSISDLPLSLSAWIRNEAEAAAVVDAGVDRFSISLDVVNPEAFTKIKGGSFTDRLDLLLKFANLYKGRVSTHIICGLGETEEETLVLIDRLIKAGVTVALFAFVPLKGTRLEKRESPELDSYRRIQAGLYLLLRKKVDIKELIFTNGQVASYGIPEENLIGLLSDGKAFQTSGCSDCNRPYYNERPGGTIYNYHRPLGQAEKAGELKVLIDSINYSCFYPGGKTRCTTNGV